LLSPLEDARKRAQDGKTRVNALNWQELNWQEERGAGNAADPFAPFGQRCRVRDQRMRSSTMP
jgi:hypothetical protein